MRRCNADHERSIEIDGEAVTGPPGPANWLDWQCPDNKCPECGAETEWFKGGVLGQLLDKVPDADQYGAPVPGSGETYVIREPRAT